jgi:hypothetical protein
MNPETTSSPQPAPTGVGATAAGEARASLLSRALLALAILFVLVRALPILTFPLGRDQATYLVVGKGLLEGKQLYQGVYDIKPPGIYIAYAGIAKLFGRVMWSAAVVDILLLFVLSYLLFRFAKPYVGHAGAMIAVVVHASWHGEIRYHWIAQPEAFQLVCVLSSILLLREGRRWWTVRCFAAGLLLGCVCWLKYNGIAFLPLLLFLPYLNRNSLDQNPPRLSLALPWRDWLARAGLLLMGLATAFGIVLAWIVLKGAWPAMKEAQFEVLPRYAAMAFQRNPHYLLSAVARTNYRLGEWSLWATLSGLFVAWRRRDLGRFAPIFFAALSAYVASVLQVRLHDYYFQTCYPFFAAVWGYAAVSIYEGSRALARNFRRRNWRLAAGLVWVVFAEAVFLPLPGEFSKLTLRYEELREWRADAGRFYSNYPRQLPFEHLPGQLEVIHYLEKNAKPRDSVYLWGAQCSIYYLTGHQPPTRFLSDSFVMSLWSPVSWREELMHNLRDSRPTFIVVTRGDELPTITYVNLDSEKYLKRFPELDTFITRNYRLVADFDTYVIYRRG